MRFQAASFVATPVFLLSWLILFALFEKEEDPSWHDAWSRMNTCHRYLTEARSAPSQLPEPVQFNAMIQDARQVGFEWNPPEDLPTLHYLVITILTDPAVCLWGKAPIYIVDEELPGGYGIYLHGEDGVSESRGNDDDDINTWDENSYAHYPEKALKLEVIKYGQFAAIPAILAFGLVAWFKRPRQS